jgi:hypothetical protein
MFRDAGLEGDEIFRRMITQLAGHLRPDGFAHVIGNWLHRGADWASPIRQWANGLGCDVWALRFESLDPVSYAARWNSHLKEKDPAGFEAAVDRWLSYYLELNVDQIAIGVVVARRRIGATNWFRAATVAGPPTGDCTEHFLRLFALPARLSDQALLDARPEPVPGQRVETSDVALGDGYRTEKVTVGCVPGLGLTAGIDPAALPVILGCDGSQTLAEIVARTGTAPDVAVPAVRKLAELGMVSLS